MSVEALDAFHQRYFTSWQQALGQHPVSDKPESGPAETGRDAEGRALWQARRREAVAGFDNVAQALELTLHPALTDLYGHFYAGNLYFEAPFGRGELLQVWCDEDFQFLQENLIGHLLMKQKLKQAPTLFIGVVEERMLVLNNDDGSVWLELPGEAPSEQVADSLAALLAMMAPVTQLPEPPAAAPAPTPSFGERIKTMLGHLWPGGRR
ncbi:SecY-interacting protein [Ferrimonas balearica]|uniref:SecY-interacting protein n=1 Tax=Ferrimonas balearica TaxID=44012 RepID=UPI001F251B38|nr:SecY-interacting protein [Ferrimonas balearica]MBY6018139.1 SecY-interacting protein [Halomonas denitrificans]MBY6094478.1 SecY-interacting protein [Ferrimonas balearica]